MPRLSEKYNSISNFEMGKVRHVHLVGVGGCGMSAIAKILFEKGYLVSGSDLKESSNTIRLKDLGIKIYIGHRISNIRGADLVLLSTAIPNDNPEAEEARRHGIKIFCRAKMLAWIMDQYSVRIAVSGTHGKTTTTSMLSQIFMEMGLDPTFLIGGETDSIDGNARLGKSPYIVAEADESDGSFLSLNPNIAVITNIEADHLNYYGSLEAIKKSFKIFSEKLGETGRLVINVDEANASNLVKQLGNSVLSHTYGIATQADLYASDIVFSKGFSTFTVNYRGKILGKVKLLVPGWHNVINSLAAIYVGLLNNLDFNSIAAALRSFRGAKRRFQLIGEISGIKIFDDYAHHPTEIKTTLQGARLNYPGSRIICIFQPHRYSRTMHLYKEFGAAFTDADIVIITNIYSAGEKPVSGISGKSVFDAIKKNGKEIHYIPRKEKISAYLLQQVKADDLVITAGAGDIYNVARDLYTRLRIKNNADSTK